jgi:NAD(P)-dependent dehydrogenase (short-subunit alcohol dehydrogenase family)
LRNPHDKTVRSHRPLALVTGSSRASGRAIAEGYLAAARASIINGRDAKAAVGRRGGLARVRPVARRSMTGQRRREAAVATIERTSGRSTSW